MAVSEIICNIQSFIVPGRAWGHDAGCRGVRHKNGRTWMPTQFRGRRIAGKPMRGAAAQVLPSVVACANGASPTGKGFPSFGLMREPPRFSSASLALMRQGSALRLQTGRALRGCVGTHMLFLAPCLITHG